MNKLYDLYDFTIKFVTAFAERTWESVTKDELMANEEQVDKYKSQCLGLPKDLKEWKAYKTLK